MKKIGKIIISLLTVLLILPSTLIANTVKAEETLKVTLIVNGNLGDLGFFDSAALGMGRLKDELGVETKIIETGADETSWEPALADAAESDADIIIAVSPSMVEPIERTAPMYTDKTFILIDNVVNYDSGEFDNVYSARFKQNEGSFLAGALAALSVGKLENTNSDAPIGFIGGMDIPAINDFLVGFIQGALYVNENAKVAATYVGDYYDPARGKELGNSLINSGVELIFPAAGPSGLGVIEAAKEHKKYIIGVDNDQAAMYLANDDIETANIIISSMEKKVGDVLYNSVKAYIDGELKLGQDDVLGVAEGAVGLSKNEIYEKLDDEIKEKIIEIEELLKNGEIEVDTAIGMDLNKLNELKNSVAP